MFKTELPEDKPTWQMGCAKCKALESAIAKKDKEIERLRTALKPFDKLYGLMDSSSTFQPYQISMDGGTKWYKISISDKQLTAAHNALNQSGEAQNKETK